MYWKLDQQLLIGIEEIDKQHQVLVDLLNTLDAAIKNHDSDKTIKSIINELFKYTKYHFASEEKQFNYFKYPQKNEHIAEHNTLIKNTKDLKERYERGETDLIPHLSNFLSDWMFEHIIGCDTFFKDYIEDYCLEKLNQDSTDASIF